MQQRALFPSMPPIRLSIRGMTIPGFKNNKMLIAKGPNGKPLKRPLLITKPELQVLMEQITSSFVSQLLCAFRTEGGETLTGCSLRSAIASSMPVDDCLTVVPEIHIRAELCEPGSEGCEVIIEKIT